MLKKNALIERSHDVLEFFFNELIFLINVFKVQKVYKVS